MNSPLTTVFPIVAILVCVFAFYQPEFFVGLQDYIISLLAAIMFAMGLSLTWNDFARVIHKRSAVILGLLLQYSLMPLLAFLLAKGLALPLELTVGMILVGAASGGTASNVICYLARADVALSISLTLCSTLVAVVMLPFITWVLLGQSVPVPALAMFKTVLQIVLIPLALGLLINHFLSALIKRVQVLLPWFSMLAIVLVIAIIVALNAERLLQVTTTIIVAVILHNLMGIALAYLVSKGLGFDTKTSQTVAIEVGMQNSGLAVAMALKYFTPLAALPGALFSIWHNVSGALLAARWGETANPSKPR